MVKYKWTIFIKYVLNIISFIKYFTVKMIMLKLFGWRFHVKNMYFCPTNMYLKRFKKRSKCNDSEKSWTILKYLKLTNTHLLFYLVYKFS